MKNDITKIIANLLRQNYDDIDNRLFDQAEELKIVTCTNPSIGNLVDAHDVKYLFSVLALTDEDFHEIFPEVNVIKREKRQQLASIIERHLEAECHHCSLKRGYDYELDSRIKRICLDNRKALKKLLEDSSQSTEDEHHGNTKTELKEKTEKFKIYKLAPERILN